MKIMKKYTLITGGTSGIGLELAKLFAQDGHNLVVVARDEQELNMIAGELRQQFGIDVQVIAKDLFEKDAAFEIHQKTNADGLIVDILVNNAGQGQYGEFIDTDIQRELQIIQLNICSLVILTKLFLKDMVIRGEGRILNLSSVASKIPGPLQSVYHGTKAFVQSFTEAIRNEVKDTGVTITALLPGATATDFFNKADMLNAKNVVDGKLADPADVAKEGYEALMKSTDKVVAGFKNKVQVAMAAVTPESILADQVHKQQAPSSQEK